MASDPENNNQEDLDLLNSSKFSEHLHTNYIPSLPEIPEINAVAESVASRMAVYDSEIEELEVQLKRLRTRRKAFQVAYDAHMALASPFRRLPPEIVQVIFVWCLPTNRNAVMHASEAPLLLARVCSDWRRLVFATPALWASLHIVPPAISFKAPGTSAARFEKKRDLVASWLGRAGICPLDASFVWFAGDSAEEKGLCEALLRVLFSYAKRWRSLHFQLPSYMFPLFEVLAYDSTPALQSFTLVDRSPAERFDTYAWPASLDFVNGATRLRSFTLTVFTGGFRLPSLPLSELTTLSLESNTLFFFDSVREMLEVLSKCQRLQRCTLGLPLRPTIIQPYEALDMPTTLPALTFLCIDCDQHLENTFHISNIIGNLITPRLCQLEFLGRPGSDVMTAGERCPTVASAIQKMLRNSACPLQKFSSESIVLEGGELVDCLKLMPSLSHLSAQNWTAPYNLLLPDTPDAVYQPNQDGAFEGELLKSLTHPPRERESNLFVSDPPNDPPASTICPKLEHFSVSLGNVPQKLFCDFAASRVRDVPPSGVPLKVAKCTFTTVEDKSTKAQLEALLREGLSASNVYRIPERDEINPSPWTGLDDLPM